MVFRSRFERDSYDKIRRRLLEQLLNHSRLHPRNLAREVLLSMYNITNATERWPVRGDEMSGKYFQTERELLYSELNKCERTALALPQNLCHEFAKKLKLNGQAISIGKESFVQFWNGFIFSGIVPLGIFSRIRRFAQSGIQARWEQLLTGLSNLIEGEDGTIAPNPARLTGNIAVLFLLLVTGYLVSMMRFLFEMAWFSAKKVLTRRLAG